MSALAPVALVAAVVATIVTAQDAIIYQARSYTQGVAGPVYAQRKHEFKAKWGLEPLLLPDAAGVKKEQLTRVVGFLIPPRADAGAKTANKGRVWLLTGGNAQLALDWLWFVERVLQEYPASHADAFVLVDYPGYGFQTSPDCPKPGESTILDNMHAALQAALVELKLGESPNEPVRVGLLGHSLGAAAATLFAARTFDTKQFRIEELCLVSPFESMARMAKSVLLSWFPLPSAAIAKLIADRNQWHITDEWTLQRLKSRHPKARVTVVHGDRDEIVPYAQGRDVWLAMRQHVSADSAFLTVAGCDHNSIFERGFADMVRGMGYDVVGVE